MIRPELQRFVTLVQTAALVQDLRTGRGLAVTAVYAASQAEASVDPGEHDEAVIRNALALVEWVYDPDPTPPPPFLSEAVIKTLRVG